MIRTGPPHSDTVETRPVSDLCTCCCRTSKDVGQQVVGWAQTRDLAAVKIADDGTSIGKLESMPAGRRCDRAWSWHHRRRRRPASRSLPAWRNDALWTRGSLAMTGLRVRRTQWVVLSAASEHSWCGEGHAGPRRYVLARTRAIQPLLTLLSQPLVQRARAVQYGIYNFMHVCAVWAPIQASRIVPRP